MQFHELPALTQRLPLVSLLADPHVLEGGVPKLIQKAKIIVLEIGIEVVDELVFIIDEFVETPRKVHVPLFVGPHCHWFPFLKKVPMSSIKLDRLIQALQMSAVCIDILIPF